MKKIVYTLAIAVLGFASCENSLEDTFDELGDTPTPVTGEATYTISEDDYDDIISDDVEEDDYYETFQRFPTQEDALARIPSIIEQFFPNEEGTKVIVNFNLEFGGPAEVLDFVDAGVFEFQDSDYSTFGANAFLLEEDPTVLIAGFLDTEFSNPNDGDVVRFEYEKFTEPTEIGIANLEEFVFENSFEGWSAFDLLGTEQEWSIDEEDLFVEMSGFNGDDVANEDWLVSPEIDLTTETVATVQINQVLSFADDPSVNQILISTEFTGDVETTVWDEIEFVDNGVGFVFVTSEDFDLSAYTGETVHIAFKYVSSDTDSGRWRVQSLNIKGIGFAGNKETINDYYVFSEASGDWELFTGAYYLTDEDYDSMGEEDGPGRFNNFSDTSLPENFLPTFLDINFPFAQEGDELNIIYRFFEGNTVTQGNLYTIVDGEWTLNLSQSKFKYTDGVFIPNNSIAYIFEGDDYDNVGSELQGVSGFESQVDNLATFGNFNRNNGATNWDDDQLLRAIEIVINNRFPGEDIGQVFEVTFNVFNGSSTQETFEVELTEELTYIIVEN